MKPTEEQLYAIAICIYTKTTLQVFARTIKAPSMRDVRREARSMAMEMSLGESVTDGRANYAIDCQEVGDESVISVGGGAG